MRITGIIEKGSDGMYSIRSEQHFGDSYFGGFGNTVAEAKQDFKDSIQEAMEETLLSGKSAEPIEVSFQYDLPSFFNDFDFINASRFAQYATGGQGMLRKLQKIQRRQTEWDRKRPTCG